MTHLFKTLAGYVDSHTITEDEYVNEADGLLYCKKCGTPRQTTVTIEGKTIHPIMLCECQSEERKREETERKRMQQLRKISAMKTGGLQDEALWGYTFENDKGYNPEIKKAHDYVEHWEEMKADSIGLLLWGDVGTGKTFFAGCIANALLDRGIPVLMTNFARILNTLSGLYSGEKNRFIEDISKYSLLIIDDLGVERNSEFALEQVYSVIDGRYRSKLPMIVTTNMELSELKNPTDLAHSRIYDRVLEMCVPIRINNRNIREINAGERMRQARRLLGAPD